AHRVSPADSPGHHQPGGKTFPVQLQRVIQPRPKDRRWPSVVLGGAQYDNGVRWMPLILLAYHEDHHQGHRVHRARGQDDEPERPAKLLERRTTSGPSPGHNSKLSPWLGTRTSRTPSSRRIAAMASSAGGSPWTTNARRIGPPSRRTQARSSSRSA